MWFNWFLPPRQQNKSADDLLSSSWCPPPWLEGLCRVCRQLNVCTWTTSWIHEFCIFFKWQHQDHQHYQIAGWNINHSKISDFKAQLQLSEWLSNTAPESGRAVCKGSLTKVEIALVTFMWVWGEKGKIEGISPVQQSGALPASWSPCFSRATRREL